MSEPINYWQQGYDDYGKNSPPRHLDNSEYMSGWVAGWGAMDAYCKEPALFPFDEDYMKGYNLTRKKL